MGPSESSSPSLGNDNNNHNNKDDDILKIDKRKLDILDRRIRGDAPGGVMHGSFTPPRRIRSIISPVPV
eukprot:CAMPEP_0181139662 /NCGR_PEP_ID=MMETSP1071-20121207/34900_1 /TAXON_ID=35127 /ORGANISM="Thalassiosira sp., Strain NH16" /LENGTH=68 /DNA_ID=CAMNT_0023226581 /DNA_START=162 /DNA_END=365 /DNA_ORIENTATION=+